MRHSRLYMQLKKFHVSIFLFLSILSFGKTQFNYGATYEENPASHGSSDGIVWDKTPWTPIEPTSNYQDYQRSPKSWAPLSHGGSHYTKPYSKPFTGPPSVQTSGPIPIEENGAPYSNYLDHQNYQAPALQLEEEGVHSGDELGHPLILYHQVRPSETKERGVVHRPLNDLNGMNFVCSYLLATTEEVYPACATNF